MYVDKFSRKIVLLLQQWFEGTAGSFPMKDFIQTNLTLIQFVVLCNYHYILLSTIKSSEFNIMCLNHLRILSRIYWDIFFLQTSTIFNVLISRDVVESIWWYMSYTFFIIIIILRNTIYFLFLKKENYSVYTIGCTLSFLRLHHCS